MTFDDLKQILDKIVTLHMADGETVRVKVCFVDDEYQDIIADVLETSRPEHYRDRSAVYAFAAADIVSVELSN